MRRPSGALHGPPVSAAPGELGRDNVYSCYADIREPMERGYYLPVIDGVYTPPFESDDRRRDVAVVALHEWLHCELSRTAAVCELRHVGLEYIGRLVRFLLANDDGSRLLVPSFRVVRRDGGTDEGLKKLADRYDDLLGAVALIQEMVIYVVLARQLSWSQEQLRDGINSALGSENSELYDNFITGSRNMRLLYLIRIARGVLDRIGLTREGCIARLRQSLQKVQHLDLGPVDDLQGRDSSEPLVEYTEHMNVAIVEFVYGMDRCPVTGQVIQPAEGKEFTHMQEATCPMREFETASRILGRRRHTGEGRILLPWGVCDSPRASSVPNSWWGDLPANMYRDGAELMQQAACGRGGFGRGRMPASERALAQSKTLPYDSEAVRVLREFHESRETDMVMWPSVLLAAERKGDGWVILEMPEHVHAVDLRLGPGWRGILQLESLREQMWAEDGPSVNCYYSDSYVCDPKIMSSCRFRELVRSLWERTEPDPGSRWKAGGPPACVLS